MAWDGVLGGIYLAGMRGAFSIEFMDWSWNKDTNGVCWGTLTFLGGAGWSLIS